MAKLDINHRISLSDGHKMPVFGFGTYMLTDYTACEKAILAALKNGYRHLDTAQFYQNESIVGDIIKKSGVPREDIWITTKVWQSHHGYKTCCDHVEKTVKKMGVGYIDLYLIHAPGDGTNVDTFKALLDMKDKGLIRSVGVSNFGVHHLEGLKKSGLPKPTVNQIELHPWRQFKDIVKYCREEGIAVEGYSPLVKGQRIHDKVLAGVAKSNPGIRLKIADHAGIVIRHNKTPAQVLIRWSLQNGYITIPMSGNPDHILENCQVFDFELSDKDMETLGRFEDNGCTWDPTKRPWTG